MTNSREIAEQAFALLRNALEESESQRRELEDQLQAPQASDSAEDRPTEALQSELEALRSERDLWKKTATQLQDVVSNERSKAKRLTKKLGVVQSGSDKVTRREVNFWREKAEHFEAARESFQQRIYKLKQELGDRDKELEAAAANQATSEQLDHANDLLAERDGRIAELSATLEANRLRAEESERQTKDLNADYQRRLDEIEAQHDSEISALREEHSGELAALRSERAETEQQLQAQQSSSSSELEQALRQLDEAEQSLEAERREHAEQLDHRDAEQSAREAMYNSSLTKERAEAADAIRAEFEPRVDALNAQLDEQTNAFAALEASLAEERERSDNLSELANDRRESLAKTTEKLEEMVERYEDAKWQLGKARYFEKLVRRRKKLIGNLIKTIRAKQKATSTLKAGLDSLRRYKATADERQQELLSRVEILERSLQEAREKLAQANEARRASAASTAQSEAAEQKAASASAGDTMQLRNQVTAQAEVIQNLEADLKNARVAETEARNKLSDFGKLHSDLETKNTFIGTLQKDIEEHQKTLAQLRKRDIEIKELKTRLEDQDRKLSAMKSENAQLRSSSNGDVSEIDQRKIAEQDQAISRLTAKLKEYEATISSLSEAVDSWKRKYDFLAADTPYGYEAASSSE